MGQHTAELLKSTDKSARAQPRHAPPSTRRFELRAPGFDQTAEIRRLNVIAYSFGRNGEPALSAAGPDMTDRAKVIASFAFGL
jgi:hypothetical protein